MLFVVVDMHEQIVHIEVGSSCLSLLHCFYRLFDLEVHLKVSENHVASFRHEVIKLADVPMHEIGLASVEDLGIVGIFWSESITEVRV